MPHPHARRRDEKRVALRQALCRVVLKSQVNAILREGLALQGQGRLVDAANRYARVRAGAPREFDGWHLGGLVALLAGRAGEAVTLLTRAEQLRPGASIALSLGIAQLANADLPAAERVLQRVTEQHPALRDGWRYLALVHETQGRTEDAARSRQKVVELAPTFGPGWLDLGSSLSLLGRQTEALACFERARKLDPAETRPRVGCAMVYLRCHRVEEAARELEAVLRQTPGDTLARSFRLTALNNLPQVTAEDLFAEHCAFGRVVGGPIPHAWSNSPDPERRLRVAFFSRDLCEHSVAYFLEPLLEHLDRGAFEVLVYSDTARSDAVTARLRSHATLWRQVAGQTDATVESLVRADRPDLLVELGGHTAANRLPLLARRLAPVQITYLGYPNTTGVPAIDYRFVDAVTDPAPAADRFVSEQLVRFAPTAWAYRPPECAAQPGQPPSVATGRVTFGSFSNFGKVTDTMLRIWAQILATVPQSRLLIKAAGVQEAAVADPLARRLQAAGISPAQVEVLPHTPDTASHLALYQQVDIALDTYPYNGTTTTCEALWMGVPVVTLAGDRHAARVGRSLLNALGRGDWATDTPQAYVSVAASLAVDSGRLAAIRAGLREEMARSGLLDHAGQAQRFGAALRDCWRRWCAARSVNDAVPRPAGTAVDTALPAEALP